MYTIGTKEEALAFQDTLPEKEKQPLGTKEEILVFYNALLKNELGIKEEALALQNEKNSLQEKYEKKSR